MGNAAWNKRAAAREMRDQWWAKEISERLHEEDLASHEATHLQIAHDTASVEARELVAAAMLQCSLATGHGDTIEDLLGEMVAQVRELRSRFCAVRDALAAMVDRWEPDTEGADRRMWEDACRALGREV